MAGVHDQGLIVLHHREVVHSQPELRPVGEHLAIATIGHQLLWKLGGRDRAVVVHDKMTFDLRTSSMTPPPQINVT